MFLAVVSLSATVALAAGLFLATSALAQRSDVTANALLSGALALPGCCSPDA